MEKGLDEAEMLEVLLERIRIRFPQLADEAMAAVNEGTDAEEVREVLDSQSSKKRQHRYRQRVVLTGEQALAKVVDLLESRLIELPMTINATVEELSSCFEEGSKSSVPEVNGLSIAIEIGGVGELVRGNGRDLQFISRVPPEEIKAARVLVANLRGLLRNANQHAD